MGLIAIFELGRFYVNTLVEVSLNPSMLYEKLLVVERSRVRAIADI